VSLASALPRRHRRAWLSWLGAALAVLYAALFVVAYVDYLNNAGQWLADLTLLLVALPFTSTMNVLTHGAFDMSGDETTKVVVAALFCSALAYCAGAIVEWGLRSLWRTATRR
jgi:drug/metabolite transporter (DMT)-like permease